MRLSDAMKMLVAMIASTLGASANAASLDEAITGDISGDGLAPTIVALDPGSNTVRGSFGSSPVPNVADLDYLTVIVPTGYRLAELVLTSLNPGGANSFLGVQTGPQFTLPPTSNDPSSLLGWNHIYANQAGTNLLPSLGLSVPLAAGSYTFWINETDTSAAWSYGFDFKVAPVPEPSSSALVVVGGGLLTLALRRRRKS